MDLSEALLAGRKGYTIRDDSGTMKPGWKVKFIPNDTPENMAKKPEQREGIWRYIDPKGEDAHQILFQTHHRVSVAWNVVDTPQPQAKKGRAK
jgi:hypothetical protein